MGRLSIESPHPELLEANQNAKRAEDVPWGSGRSKHHGRGDDDHRDQLAATASPANITKLLTTLLKFDLSVATDCADPPHVYLGTSKSLLTESL
jgi:hypothetical protein